MNNKTANILKSAFFCFIFISCILYKVSSGAENLWPYIGMLLSAIAAIGYIKKAFDKY